MFMKRLWNKCRYGAAAPGREDGEKVMKLIVGLGNIGSEYAHTRHNIGFMVADELAGRWGVSFGKASRGAMCAEYRAPEKVLLLKPVTYMNLSGTAVGAYARFYNIAPENIAVVQDDLDLPCGQLRIRRKGSDGGHNGIKSIMEQLGTGDFPRFKIGIGHPGRNNGAVIAHVLHPFREEEKELVAVAVRALADALERWLREDIALVMQDYNKKPGRERGEDASAPKAIE